MKLRIKGNSVRVRLTQSEVARLAAGQRIEQVTEFSNESRLISSIQCSEPHGTPQVIYENNRLSVLVPDPWIRQWAASDQVSIEAEQTIGGDRQLRLLVEKDFQCLHSQPDDDAYPNPRVA